MNQLLKFKILQEHSNIIKAKKLAYDIYDKPLNISTRKYKKYMIKNPLTNRYIHFGDIRYEDYLYTKNPIKRNSYLKRSEKIKGNWKDDDYSPNNLSRRILWDEFNII
jgi:hypothetical protein